MKEEIERTTMLISKKTLDRLRELKSHPNQSYEEVILILLGDKINQDEVQNEKHN